MDTSTLDLLDFLILAITGFAAGWINVLAGGGSLLTMPMAIFLGLEAGVANGTARLAILVQNITAISRYQQKKAINWKEVIPYVIPCTLGALIGARFAALASHEATTQILGLAIIGAVMMVIIKPTQKKSETTTERPLLRFVAFFLIGIYGGAIQAGVGYLLIAGLTFIGGMTLVNANILKVILVGAYTPFVIVFFWQASRIHLYAALALAVGQSMGAWLAASFALEKSEKWVRAFLLVTVIASAAKLLGLF